MKKIILCGVVSMNFLFLGCSEENRVSIPTYDISTQLKKFHDGYQAKNLIGSSNCGGVFPQALLDTKLRGSASKEKLESISWTGGCEAGLMHGKGSIQIKPNSGSNSDYLYLTGTMDHGFFIGNVQYEVTRNNSSSRTQMDNQYVKLNNYSDYVQYETKKGYNTAKVTSSGSGIDASLLGIAAVGLVGYGIYKLYGGGDSSSASSSTYSNSSSSSENYSSSSHASNSEIVNKQSTSPSDPVKNIYDGGYKSSKGSIIYKIECSNGSKYGAYQESDGYWYSVGSNYGDTYRNLSKNEFANKLCQ